MENKTIFRQSTLERLSSPEQLDQLMKITSPAGWAALIALILLLCGAVVWGFIGRVATKVYGQGILLSPGGVNTVVALSEGQVEDIYYDVGDTIAANSVVARIREPGATLATRVISPIAGKIVEVQASINNLVERGDPIITVENNKEAGFQALEAILYLSPAEGKQISPGMSVEVSPSTVRREESGYMIGKVISVGEFPASRAGMLRVLGNEELIGVLSTSGAPLEVRVTLQLDPNTHSGYAWSSSSGPNAQIDSGTLCSAWITIREQRPIGWVINNLR